MKSSSLLLLLLGGIILGFVLSGCSTGATPTTTETLKVTVETEPSPPQLGDGRLLISITDADGKLINDVKVDISMGMSSMSMNTQDGQADKDEKGHYVRAVTFHSKGQYTVRVWVRRAGQTLTMQDVQFSVS